MKQSNIKEFRYNLKEFEQSTDEFFLTRLLIFPALYKLKTERLLIENEFLRFQSIKKLIQESKLELNNIQKEIIEANQDNTTLKRLRNNLLSNNRALYRNSIVGIAKLDKQVQHKNDCNLLNTNIATLYIDSSLFLNKKDIKKAKKLFEKYTADLGSKKSKYNYTVIDNRRSFSIDELFPIIYRKKHGQLFSFALNEKTYTTLETIALTFEVEPEQIIRIILEYNTEFKQFDKQKSNHNNNSVLNSTRESVKNKLYADLEQLKQTRPEIASITYRLFEKYQENQLRTIQLSAFIAQTKAFTQKWNYYIDQLEDFLSKNNKKRCKETLIDMFVYLKRVIGLDAFERVEKVDF